MSGLFNIFFLLIYTVYAVCSDAYIQHIRCWLMRLAAVTGKKKQVAIPTVSEAGVVSKWSELDGGGGSKAIDRVKNRDYDGSLYMVNKPPRWNDQV